MFERISEGVKQTMQNKDVQKAAIYVAVATLITGIAILIIALAVKGSLSTKTDFTATYRSSRLGDFSHTENVTKYVTNSQTLGALSGVAMGSGLTAVILIGLFYFRAKMSVRDADEAPVKGTVAMTQANDKPTNGDTSSLKDRASCAKVGAMLLGIACLAAISITAFVLLHNAKMVKLDTIKWDARYIWTPVGGWVKGGVVKHTVLNDAILETIKTAGIVMTSVGGGVLFLAALYAAHKKYAASQAARQPALLGVGSSVSINNDTAV